MPAPTPASGPDGRPGSVRAQLVQAVACLQLALDGSLTFPLTVEVRGANGAAVSFQIQSPSELGGDVLANLSDMERAIVEAAPADRDQAVTRPKLARLSGQKFNSYFHVQVRGLIDARILAETSGKKVYRL